MGFRFMGCFALGFGLQVWGCAGRTGPWGVHSRKISCNKVAWGSGLGFRV